MSKIIAISSQKGGVGKTTTALNLGYSLSRLGGRVLIVDGDPQGGIAISSNLRKRTELGLVDVLYGRASNEEIVMQTRDRTLSIAGIGNLEPPDVLYLEQAAREGRLGTLLRSLSEPFDHLIIDVPAGVGGMVTGLLGSADSVILVILCRNLSLKTLPSFLRMLDWLAENMNPSIYLEGVLFTMMQRENQRQESVYNEIRTLLPEEAFFKTTIPEDEACETASLRAVPVAMLKEGGPAASAYLNLAVELKEREIRREMSQGGSDNGEPEGLF